jgi:hypothetical protein
MTGLFADAEGSGTSSSRTKRTAKHLSKPPPNSRCPRRRCVGRSFCVNDLHPGLMSMALSPKGTERDHFSRLSFATWAYCRLGMKGQLGK